MSLLLSLFGIPLAAVLFLVALAELAASAKNRRRAVRGVLIDVHRGGMDITTARAAFARTRVGRWLTRELARAGSSLSPLAVFASAVAISGLSFIVTWIFLAPLLAVVALAVGGIALRWYIKRGQERRKEAFVAQLPEVARVLSNGTHAGLSLPTAIAVAADEVDEPAAGELRLVSDALRFGSSMDGALDEMMDRMPSRESRVLISTLMISSRTGGSLVTSLRQIADTLDARKETRREVKTTLAQAMATSRLILILAVGILWFLNGMMPGVVEKMTSNPIGILALVISGGLFTAGFFMIQAQAKMDL